PQTLTPVYPTTAGLGQAYLRKAILSALARTTLPEILPQAVLDQVMQFSPLWSIADAVKFLHQPPPDISLASLEAREHPAWQRIKFDELLAQQLSLKRAHHQRRMLSAPALPQNSVATSLLMRLLDTLPFVLTDAQQKVWREMSVDLTRTYPMQRLLQGDVGSGKTVVAALAATQAIDAHYQVALMVPTELLAEQHFRKMAAWLTPLGIKVVWLAGGMRTREKREVQSQIATGEVQLVIGTHALIQKGIDFARLGLVIVDEQHRFGVGQRLALRELGRDGVWPHQLMMSATPIPRTLAMTYYADLDVSVIDALPPGRTPVVTRLVNDKRRMEVMERVRAAARLGRQIYWVCPLIEESEALQLQTAVETHALLSELLPELTVGLVHGRLPAAEKAAVMQAFSEKTLQLLVATTVIEVGVDVPNASLMVIEHAERFGLAQLHQLRGRVGRGSEQSACVLLYQTPLSAQAKQRLATMRETNDGFVVAQRDLAIRGPGEFLGARQSGQVLLRFVDLALDAQWIAPTSDAAAVMLAQFPRAVEAHLQRWLGVRDDYLKT
ncbi:MAG: ATP-dependent DNA helicase RecG, partial [Ottowia sp.]|nr:ATP-dependent DNA helicase RecG [Ottowia sp.]